VHGLAGDDKCDPSLLLSVINHASSSSPADTHTQNCAQDSDLIDRDWGEDDLAMLLDAHIFKIPDSGELGDP
jgi:hypothetical protein